jgi:hypothetical protein
LLAIAFTATSTSPPLNNGDYGRTTRSFDLDFPIGGDPGACPVFRPDLSYPPASPLSLAGIVTAGAVKLAGQSCFPTGLWFALFSAIFWAGVLADAILLKGRRIIALTVVGITSYLLFAEMLASFYEEAFFAALIPWTALIRFGNRRAMALALAIALLALVSKTQAVFFVPILVLLFAASASRVNRWSWLLVAAVLLGGIAIDAAKTRYHSHINAYNRIYAGLGWAALGVADWPANEFIGRRVFFYANLSDDGFGRSTKCAIAGRPLLGTTYFPTAADVIDGKVAGSAVLKTAVHELGFGDFVHCARDIGSPLATVGQVYAVFLQSDYNLAYLRTAPPSGASQTVMSLRNALLRWAGPLFVVIAIGAAALFRRRLFALAAIYLVLGAPAFVFLGDGFYEFEKHMLLNFMMLAGCIFAALRQADECASAARADDAG